MLCAWGARTIDEPWKDTTSRGKSSRKPRVMPLSEPVSVDTFAHVNYIFQLLRYAWRPPWRGPERGDRMRRLGPLRPGCKLRVRDACPFRGHRRPLAIHSRFPKARPFAGEGQAGWLRACRRRQRRLLMHDCRLTRPLDQLPSASRRSAGGSRMLRWSAQPESTLRLPLPVLPGVKSQN